MKPFSLFLAEINEGSTNAALTAHITELFQAVKTHGRSGSLKLQIKVVPAVKGAGDVDKITVTVESQLALPKPQQPSDFFFLTDDAEPTRQHPRQHSLDLRDVSGQARGGVVDASSKFTQPDADGVITFKEVAP
jgi:hypothetical protein